MNDLLKSAIEAHGGLENWRSVKSLDVTVSFKGGLFPFKGHPDGFPSVVMNIDTHKPEVVTAPYPSQGRRGHYTSKLVSIRSLDGTILERREDFHHRIHSQQLADPWDQLDRLAFVSYAMWEYLNVPFVLAEPDFVVEEIKPLAEYGDKPWRALRVIFPDRIPVHSKEQFFYFDEQSLLRRFDFQAIGSGAHYCFDYISIDGLKFPMLRRIIAKEAQNSMFQSSTGVLIEISDIRINR
ncbi:hypothetical protein ACQ86G_29225 [Roseateles chitinivorans]|uniref:hypothetical protein n=1 Tax=Roseateles chitinivorans TaxID=2917965 RepID=UPI003D66B310